MVYETGFVISWFSGEETENPPKHLGSGGGKGGVGAHTLAHTCIIARATVIISRKCGCVRSAASSTGFLYSVPPFLPLPRTLHKPQHTHSWK